jgi:hypothetical protein
MLYDEAGPELAAGARLIGQALCLSRALDREVSSMERKQESPSTVCRPSKGSKLKEIKYKGIAIFHKGQAENLANILAWQPVLEMVPAALLVAIAGGSLWVP